MSRSTYGPVPSSTSRPIRDTGSSGPTRASRPSGWRFITRQHRGLDGATTVAEEEKLKLGKGAAFVKSRLKRLPQGNDIWEADFRALPKPIEQTVTHYQGMVVTLTDGSLLAE